MAERSFVFAGNEVGDAVNAPWESDDFADFLYYALEYYTPYEQLASDADVDKAFADIFGASLTHVPLRAAVIGGVGYMLIPYNTGGLTYVLRTGAAIVDGRLYTTDANVGSTVLVAPGSGYNWYAFGLECNYTAQTVRCVVQGPQAAVYSLTKIFNSARKSSSYYAVVALARIDNASVVTIYDCRRIIPIAGYQNVPIIARKGGHATYWGNPGTTTYYVGSTAHVQPFRIGTPQNGLMNYRVNMKTGLDTTPIVITTPCGIYPKHTSYGSAGSGEYNAYFYAEHWDGIAFNTPLISGIVLGGDSQDNLRINNYDPLPANRDDDVYGYPTDPV